VGEDNDDVVVVNVETIVEPLEINVVVIVAVAIPPVSVLDPPDIVEMSESLDTQLSDAWDVVERLETDDADISDHQYSSVRLEYGPSSDVTVLYPILY
jgi:hypothetical protein